MKQTNPSDLPLSIAELPEHLRRYETREACESLARQFRLPRDEYSQDWAYEVADASRFAEFLAAYQTEAMTEDERFTLMQILIQCVDDLANDRSLADLEGMEEWVHVSRILLAAPGLHASTIHYWSVLDETDPENVFAVTPAMRQVWIIVQVRLKIGATTEEDGAAK